MSLLTTDREKKSEQVYGRPWSGGVKRWSRDPGWSEPQRIRIDVLLISSTPSVFLLIFTTPSVFLLVFIGVDLLFKCRRKTNIFIHDIAITCKHRKLRNWIKRNTHCTGEMNSTHKTKCIEWKEGEPSVLPSVGNFLTRFSDFSDPLRDFISKKRLATNLVTYSGHQGKGRKYIIVDSHAALFQIVILS